VTWGLVVAGWPRLWGSGVASLSALVFAPIDLEFQESRDSSTAPSCAEPLIISQSRNWDRILSTKHMVRRKGVPEFFPAYANQVAVRFASFIKLAIDASGLMHLALNHFSIRCERVNKLPHLLRFERDGKSIDPPTHDRGYTVPPLAVRRLIRRFDDLDQKFKTAHKECFELKSRLPIPDICHVSCVLFGKCTIPASAHGGLYGPNCLAGNNHRTHLPGSHGPENAGGNQESSPT
jgi:hypothetical protein